MKRFAALTLALVLLTATPACYTFHHTVGTGASTGQKVEESQWFILWGLVPLSKTDSKQLAGGAANYVVTTQFTFLDVVISLFTGFVTIYKQTIVVEK